MNPGPSQRDGTIQPERPPWGVRRSPGPEKVTVRPASLTPGAPWTLRRPRHPRTFHREKDRPLLHEPCSTSRFASAPPARQRPLRPPPTPRRLSPPQYIRGCSPFQRRRSPAWRARRPWPRTRSRPFLVIASRALRRSRVRWSRRVLCTSVASPRTRQRGANVVEEARNGNRSDPSMVPPFGGTMNRAPSANCVGKGVRRAPPPTSSDPKYLLDTNQGRCVG